MLIVDTKPASDKKTPSNNQVGIATICAALLGGVVAILMLLADTDSIPRAPGILDVVLCPPLLLGVPLAALVKASGASVAPWWSSPLVYALFVSANAALYAGFLRLWRKLGGYEK